MERILTDFSKNRKFEGIAATVTLQYTIVPYSSLTECPDKRLNGYRV